MDWRRALWDLRRWWAKWRLERELLSPYQFCKLAEEGLIEPPPCPHCQRVYYRSQHMTSYCAEVREREQRRRERGAL